MKLFFLLTYLKSNGLQQQRAASCGVSQARVSQLAAGLLPVLNHVLARRGLLPVRDATEVAQRLAHHPEPVFTYGGVERGVPRKANYEAQAAEYSAKKAYRLQHMTLCDLTQNHDLASGRPSYNGRAMLRCAQHDGLPGQNGCPPHPGSRVAC